MNRVQRLSAEFGSNVEFELTPTRGTVSWESVRIRFQQLQIRLMEETLGETANPSLRENIQRAANEAAALSWTTQFPLLIMPVLFQEKTRSARLQLEKQRQVSMRSERIVEAVEEDAAQSLDIVAAESR